MKKSTEYQLNAIIKHFNRNNISILKVEIKDNYTGDYISEDGKAVFVYHAPYTYCTLKSIIAYRERLR